MVPSEVVSCNSAGTELTRNIILDTFLVFFLLGAGPSSLKAFSSEVVTGAACLTEVQLLKILCACVSLLISHSLHNIERSQSVCCFARFPSSTFFRGHRLQFWENLSKVFEFLEYRIPDAKLSNRRCFAIQRLKAQRLTKKWRP